MSHFSTIRTRMVEKDYLKRTLQDLGYACEEGEVSIGSWGSGRMKVEIKVRLGPFSCDVGFVKKGDAYEAVADWMGVPGIDRKKFVEQLTQRYAYHAARAKLEEQGFALVAEESQKDGGIRLVLRRMA
jgi:hypothetical protein